MYNILVNINEKGRGFFMMKLESKTVGKVKVSIIGNELLILDIIVPVKRYVYTIGSRLLQEILEYGRMHELKIITVSRFVQAQFNSNPVSYTEVWEKHSV